MRRSLVLIAGLVIVLALGAGPAWAGDTLLGSQTLQAGQTLTSGDGHYELAMQGDGNLVLYQLNGSAIDRPLWSTGTAGDDGDRAVLQSDGNLVLYDAGNEALWSSNTSGAGCTNLVVQDDGNLVLYNGTGNAVFQSGTVDTTLQDGDELVAGQAIYSPSHQYELVMQGDGNLVLYGPTGALWSSGTNGIAGNDAILQSDGNLVVYTSLGRALWSSGTAGDPGDTAALQDDGNFVIYDGGVARWNTETSGARAAGTPQLSPPAFTPCPAATPAPAATSSTPQDPVVLVPTRTATPRLRVHLTLAWTWDHAVTHLDVIRVSHVSRHARTAISCHGAGCPRRRLRRVHRIRGLVHELRGLSFRAGDHLRLAISERGFATETVTIRIRDGREPVIALARAHRRHHRARRPGRHRSGNR